MCANCSRPFTTPPRGAAMPAVRFSIGYLSLGQKARADSLYFRICECIERNTGQDRLAYAAVRVGDVTGHAGRSVPVRFFGLPVHARSLGHRSAFSDHAAAAARRSSRPACDAGGPDLRLRRQDQRTTCPYDEQRRYLDVHALRDGEPYYLGFFLMGAYQDIMGDAHNLFGRVSEVHVYADDEEEDGFWIEKIIPGSQVQDMLAQVQYFPNDLQRRMSDIVRRKVQAKRLRAREGVEILDQYRAFFSASPYLDPQQMPGESARIR